MSNILLIAGPGGTAFGPSDVSKMSAALEQAGAKVSVIGNGEKPISVNDVSRVLAEEIHKEGKTTLLVMAHGDVKNGKHLIDIDGKWGLTSADLFNDISTNLGDTPFDVFMTCCHGGGAIPETDRLPKGSTLVALAPGSETVSGMDIDRLIENIQPGKLNARGLLDVYLGKSLKNRIAPVIAISGSGVADLPRAFIQRCGQNFSAPEREAAHRQMDSVIGAQAVDKVLDKVAGAKSEWDVSAVEFGPALAVTHAAAPKVEALASYNPSAGSHGGSSMGTGHRMSIDDWTPTIRFTRFAAMPARNPS